MLSVVIPTLEAAPFLAKSLPPLVSGVVSGLVRELIIVDGGSTDDTVAIAEEAGARLLRSEPGRAKQLRAGAATARADWLLFLHADTALDPGWEEEVGAFMRATGDRHMAAAFRFAFDDASASAQRANALVALRCALLKLPYGDQGLLLSRRFYDHLGGYADLPLMEDVDIVRRIGRRRLVMLRTRAVTSAAKYIRDGYLKRSTRNLMLVSRYLLGADAAKLARRYD